MEIPNVYKYLEYQKYFRDYASYKAISFRSLASNADIHSSYFSRVMMLRAHFSQEQIYKISQLLELDQETLDYLLLLGQYSTSGIHEHRQFLLKKINQLRENKLKLKEHLQNTEPLEKEKLSTYYLDPLTAKIHMFLTVKKYRENIELIKRKLQLSETKLKEELKKLSHLGLISLQKNHIKIIQDSVHLDESDPLSSINHTHWRLEAIKTLMQKKEKLTNYHFSVAFSANEETALNIKQKIKDLLLETQKLVSQIKEPDDIFYLTFDFFSE